ncbi:MAG: hypothetical protein MJ245_02950 [Clostridia bacterium]|nr:hypothetical protein [Clostridia bacterium]
MIEVDNKQILKLFANLNTKKQKKVYKNALKKASNIVVKEAKKELKGGGIKKLNTVHTTKTGKTYSLLKGIKGLVWKSGEGATISILGDFRLKFFELGTKLRKTKRGWNRGYIKAIHFFSRARQSKEKEVFDNINKLLSEEINKISKK